MNNGNNIIIKYVALAEVSDGGYQENVSQGGKNGNPCFVVMKYFLKLFPLLICRAGNLPKECLALGEEFKIENVGTACQSLLTYI